MERLTRKIVLDNQVELERCLEINCNSDCGYCDFQHEANAKLKAYEDAEEQGLLHKAPLKNGTPICYLQYSDPEGEYLAHDTYLFGVTEYMHGELGEDVWLTEEEAEAALRKRWGNE